MAFEGVIGAYSASAFAVIYCDIHANHKMITTMPNTALEPTAFTPVRSRFGRRLADGFCRRGSAFGR